MRSTPATMAMAAILVLAGCTDTAPAGDETSHGGSSPAPAATATAPLTIPPASPTELARATVIDGSVTTTQGDAPATAGNTFVEAACEGSPGSAIAYRVIVDGAAISGGDVPCNGETVRNTAASITAGATVSIAVEPSDGVANGFAAVIPE